MRAGRSDFADDGVLAVVADRDAGVVRWRAFGVHDEAGRNALSFP